ncbi:hypothetical protein BDW59DRAFT_139839 [Aspergillus cavernicola]|uniref:Kinesin light chain n=1 Tax=Aspergillus cavernicola TaxID=176166 RepID=A0ABR4IWQ4_9EURO
MANLAYTWKLLANNQDALALMEKCVDLCNKVLGSDHAHAISSFNTLSDWENSIKLLTATTDTTNFS